MADAIGSRVPPPPGRLYGADRRNQARINRQLQQPRVDLPRGGSGGGVPVGIVNLGSVNGSVTLRSGGSEIAWEAVEYGEPETIYGGANWLTVSGSDISVTPGLYVPVLLVWLRWATADAPDAVQVYMGGGQDWAHQNPTTVPPLPNSAGTELSINSPFDHGPTWMASGDYLRAEVQFAPAAGAILAGAYHNWTITKLA